MKMERLPDFSLSASSFVGGLFLTRGLTTLREAALHVHDLPYGRNSDRSDWRLVLPEERGTCSTKHALLAELAREHDFPVELRIGIYEMDPENTPGVGGVLEKHGLDHIPEAHCYLVYEDERIDVTNAGTVGIPEFLYEEEISPGQIGAHKIEVHQRFLKDWAWDLNLDFEYVWQVREECIAALSSGDC